LHTVSIERIKKEMSLKFTEKFPLRNLISPSRGNEYIHMYYVRTVCMKPGSDAVRIADGRLHVCLI
jgi:hypothetical protein